MRMIHHQTDDPAAQLAFDEAVLLEADDLGSDESLRLWEFSQPVVVIGRSSKYESEVDLEFCAAEQIPVLRRCSGGASIAAGPGCLMYSVVLSFDRRPEVQKIDVAHQFVMQRLLNAVRVQLPSAEMQGTCDLTWNNRKFSGNSLRLARRHLLYHGTILYGADLTLISRSLGTPPRQPEYRRERPHADFIANVPVNPLELRNAIERVFTSDETAGSEALTVDSEIVAAAHERRLEFRTTELLASRYSDPSWHRRH